MTTLILKGKIILWLARRNKMPRFDVDQYLAASENQASTLTPEQKQT